MTHKGLPDMVWLRIDVIGDNRADGYFLRGRDLEYVASVRRLPDAPDNEWRVIKLDAPMHSIHTVHGDLEDAKGYVEDNLLCPNQQCQGSLHALARTLFGYAAIEHYQPHPNYGSWDWNCIAKYFGFEDMDEWKRRLRAEYNPRVTT